MGYFVADIVMLCVQRLLMSPLSPGNRIRVLNQWVECVTDANMIRQPQVICHCETH